MSVPFANRCAEVAIVLGTLLICANANAGDADPKAVMRLVKEIEQTPSLYAKADKPLTIAELPMFSAKKMAELFSNNDPPLEKAQGRWKADRPGYEKAQPLRGAYFAAAEGIEEARRLATPALTIPRAGFNPKVKVMFLKKQEPIGVTVFKLEQILDKIAAAEDQRVKEPSKQWRARYDWARVLLEADLIFLFEYSYTLGQVRADNLPELKPEHVGWKIQFAAKISVPEGKAKNYQKSLGKRMKAMQDDYAETPWAFFAERESRRGLGMQWVAKKQ